MLNKNFLRATQLVLVGILLCSSMLATASDRRDEEPIPQGTGCLQARGETIRISGISDLANDQKISPHNTRYGYEYLDCLPPGDYLLAFRIHDTHGVGARKTTLSTTVEIKFHVEVGKRYHFGQGFDEITKSFSLGHSETDLADRPDGGSFFVKRDANLNKPKWIIDYTANVKGQYE